MLIVGDVHGKIDSYLNLLHGYRDQSSVQIGDMGFGFLPLKEFDRLPANAWFFRGNHDHPDLARKSQHCLGDWGIREIDGVRFFFLSGAWSIDQALRIEGLSWWRDEELSIAELNKAVEFYADTKPDIVLSHDGPNIATDVLMNKFTLHKDRPIPTRTGQALSAMWEIHWPKQWIFGHWHVNWKQKIGNTDFRCLAELGWCEI